MSAGTGLPGGPAVPPPPDQAPGAGDRSVTVQGDNHGNVSTGDHSINVMYVDGKYVETQSVLELPLREPPPLRAPAEGTALFGRDALVEQVTGKLAEGGSVQLYGAEGVGKKAIAEAVHRELAARGKRGHVLSPRPGEETTLSTLHQRLAEAFLGKTFLRTVDETALHAAVAQVTDAHLTVFDCALPGDDLAQLLQTFPGCTFLFTSPYPTLPDTSATHHVQPLARDAAIDLLSAELGLPLGPVGLQNLQFDHAYAMAEGKPQRLCQYAQFVKGSDQWRAEAERGPHDRPPPVDPDRLSPEHQAEALAVALSEPARAVLVALATFGVPLTDAWFAPVTGDPRAAHAGPELYDRRLVTHSAGAYQLTADAAQAVAHQKWPPTSATTAAEGLTAALAPGARPPGPDPDPYLLLVVARALSESQQWVALSRLVKNAAPAALTAGRGQIALQLYVLGKRAAGHGGTTKDLTHYDSTEKHLRNLLEGDKLAAAAALALLAAPAAPLAKIGSIFRSLAKIATAHTAATATTVVVAVAATTTIVVATSDDTPAGCAEAKSAITYSKTATDLRDTQDFVDRSRRIAAGLNTAAEKATDAKVKSVLRTRATERTNEADTSARKGDDPNIHPDVTAALIASQSLRANIKDLQEISPVCPNTLE